MANVTLVDPSADPPLPPLPYPPSWLDQVTAWVRQLPVPAWLFYLTLWLLLFCIETVVKWRDGTYAVGALYPFHLVFTATAFSVLSTKQYLQKTSSSALDELRPVLNTTAVEYEELHYRFTTFPARPIVLVSCIGIGIGLLFIPLYMLRVPSVKYGSSALAFGLDTLVIVWTWANIACAVYANIYLMRLVDYIYTTHTQIDLFALDSLYALTRPLALLALSMLFWAYAWVVTTPGMLIHPVGLGVILGFSLIAVATFVLPLVGVHRLLVEQKRKVQREIALLLKRLIGEAHQQIDANALENLPRLKEAMQTLLTEEEVVAKISTWPWRPGTVGALTTTLLLPLVLWLSQWLLQHYLE
jgi:hypothetical protein